MSTSISGKNCFSKDIYPDSHDNSGAGAGVAGVAGPSDHELAISLQRQDAAGVERDQAWSQFKQSQLGGDGGQLSEWVHSTLS